MTLEGERADWEKLVLRLDKLPNFGREPAAWERLLRPILTRFVRAFDGEPDINFWNRVCHQGPLGSGMSSMTGWLTAFCVWLEHGKWQGPPLGANEHERLAFDFEPPQRNPENGCILDGVSYPVIYEIPVGFCEVDVKLVGAGEV